MPLPTLFFAHNGKWESLSVWAEYFLSIGSCIGSQEGNGLRTIVGVVAPTAAYSAALAAAGVVLARCEASTAQPTLEQHFRRLQSLKVGEMVMLGGFKFLAQ